MITITLSTGGTLDVYPTDESYRYRRIMGENALNLTFSLAEHTDIPLGSTIIFQGFTYTLYMPVVIKKIHSRNFEYTANFESEQAHLSKYKFKDTASG
ncbi:MAG: hypothetical protein LBQ31_09255, partial [Bacteroidales bacterium]|nr:hypothetical protein [Bacteroidales bacterium]